MEHVLEVSHLSVQFGKTTVPRDLSFQVARGTSLAILGPNASGKTVLFISHELSVVSRYANNVLCLSRERVCIGPPRTVLTPELLQELYGAPMDYHVHDQ